MQSSALKLSYINLYAQCAGAAKMITRTPKTDATEAQQEGILAHETLVELAHGRNAPNEATDEMIAHAVTYLESLTPLLEKDQVLKGFEVPVQLYLAHGHIVKGRADFLAYDEKTKTVIVHDYKYGHTPISAEYDLQTLIYAVAAYPMAKRAIVAIEQPRSFAEKHSTYVYEKDKFVQAQKYARGVIFNAAQEDAELTPGAHCAKCPARAICPSLNYNALSLSESADKYPVTQETTPAQLSRELTFLSRVQTVVDARVAALRDEATHQIASGSRVPGYTLKSASSRLEWMVDKAVLAALAEQYGLQLMKPPEPVTPLQAVAKGLPEEVMQLHTVRKQGALKLHEMTQREISKKLEA